jgi:hypothetical protein
MPERDGISFEAILPLIPGSKYNKIMTVQVKGSRRSHLGQELEADDVPML